MSADAKKRAASLFYEEHGSGDDVIVWLHGFGCSTENWSQVVPSFEEYHSFVFDLPGHGESADLVVPGTIASFASPVVAAIEELELDRFTLIGYSAGGAVGMRIAIDLPERVSRLIGVVPWNAAGVSAEPPEKLAEFDAFADMWGDAVALTVACNGMSITDPPRTGGMVPDWLKVPEETWKGWGREGVRISQADELPGVRVPVTYLLGAEDTVVSVAAELEDARAIPGGRALVLSGVGHLWAWEDPASLVQELLLQLQSGSIG